MQINCSSGETDMPLIAILFQSNVLAHTKLLLGSILLAET